MCLIVLQEAGDKVFSKLDMMRAWSENPDGAGYMFVAHGNLVLRKPFFKLKGLRRQYRRDFKEWGDRSPFVLHFRYATHGPKSETNTHPHPMCNGEVGMAHNGILPWIPEDKEISDTVYFARWIDDNRREVLMDTGFHKYLEDEIGWNKLVFLDKLGTIAIVNERMGEWEGRRWYSVPSFAHSYHSVGFKGKRSKYVDYGSYAYHKGWGMVDEYESREDTEFRLSEEEEENALDAAWEAYLRDPENDESAWDRYQAEERRLLES